MAKRKDKREAAKLYKRVLQTAAQSLLIENSHFRNRHGKPFVDDILHSINNLSNPTISSAQKELTMMKKFRFQLLQQWMTAHLEPSRIADVGGGKGLLSFLLQHSGWQTTVIDPVEQTLPSKYKDLSTNKQTSIATSEKVTRINSNFELSMAQHFDLMVAMHAHGCNIQLIEAAMQYSCGLILLPCCVIHEPILPPKGVQWIQWLVEYMIGKGFMVVPFRLNFKGQNIGMYALPRPK